MILVIQLAMLRYVVNQIMLIFSWLALRGNRVESIDSLLFFVLDLG